MNRPGRLSRSGCELAIGIGIVLGSLFSGAAAQDNIVPNPGFEGTTGAVVGAVNLLTGGVPEQWRAFAVGGGAAEIEVVPLAADEIFPGSPPTNGVLFRVNAFGADQGFDDDNGRFPVIPGLEYHAEFWIRSGNFDLSEQQFNLGFPLFNDASVYLGLEPGGMGGQTATADWQLFTGPAFTPNSPAAQGHISWRCVNNGGENAILIAMPSVTFTGMLQFPTGLACRRENLDVALSWQNNAAYDTLRILRDGLELAALDPADTSFRDIDVPDGVHSYRVLASIAVLEDGPSCEAAVFRLAIGERVSVDLNDIDIENGLVNNVRGDGGDGENAFLVCGPGADPREARSNYGPDDPTPDFPDPVFYFNVIDPAMKAQAGYRLEATVYDDPLRAGAVLYLQYTNAASTGPTDIPNTFFPLGNPLTNTLAGTDEWVVLSWDLPNAGFRSFQQGQADFRIGTADGGRVCIDKVELIHFPPPFDLGCRRQGDGVELSWRNGGAYEAIRITRNGADAAMLAGGAESYFDAGAPEGTSTYQVLAAAAGLEGGPSCAFTFFRVPPGTAVSVDLGDPDLELGLVNAPRADGGDGENEFIVCGPAGDPREARSNYGNDDPTPEFPDGNFYFTVIDEPMKAQAAFRLEATVYDDPARAGAGIYLQYTNADSTGPGDIPNTFYPVENPPVRTLAGSDAWVVLAWDIENAGFRSFQQSAADFRLGVTDGGRVCIDKVALTFPGAGEPPAAPAGLTATAGDGQVILDWEDNAEPDLQGYNVYRAAADGGPYDRIADLVAPSAYTDAAVANGVAYFYVVRAVNPAGESPDSNQAGATPGPAPTLFRRGDADANGSIEITDPINVLGFLFLGEAQPPCFDAADADDNGALEITDAIVSLGFQFLGEPPPPAPGPLACGPDPTPDPPGADFGCDYPPERCL